ncbi:MAG: ISL3 family transposase [Deltaproteobacteria bacterium]|nr:ISL3 family transposase [Deltaproteobacteria bacterium]
MKVVAGACGVGYGRAMRDRDLYARMLGIEAPWKVEDVELDVGGGEVVVHLVHQGKLTCAECGAVAPGYDTRERRWRHLDTMQFRTILAAKVPRTKCETHGVLQMPVPWSEPGSGFTALYEALIIDLLGEMSFSAVTRLTGMSWSQVDGVHERAVRRGLARREARLPKKLGVDETSFQKRHEYVTVVSDDQGQVVHVADGRGRDALDVFCEQFDEEALAKVEVVAMDMHAPYIRSTEDHVPGAKEKIAFDKFHVAKHLGDAVDKVRRKEHRELMAWGDDTLKGTRYDWLKHPKNVSDEAWKGYFAELRQTTLRTARAWGYKEWGMSLWDYQSRGWARRGWQKWYASAIRCRLEPVKRVARTVKAHLAGIITAVVKRVTNARAEGINSVIQKLKGRARGYRNRTRFRNAIYFHLGGLELYPESVRR